MLSKRTSASNGGPITEWSETPLLSIATTRSACDSGRYSGDSRSSGRHSAGHFSGGFGGRRSTGGHSSYGRASRR